MDNEKDIKNDVKTPQLVTGNCYQCKSPIQMPFPPITAMGDQVVSVIGIPHTTGIECGNCGLYHNITIAQANVHLVLVPMEKPKGLNEEKQVIPIHEFPSLKSIKGN